MTAILDQAAMHWAHIAPLLAEPESEADYDAKVEALDELLGAIGDDENHPLASLAAAWVMASRPTTKNTAQCPVSPALVSCATSSMSTASLRVSYRKLGLSRWCLPSGPAIGRSTGAKFAPCLSGLAFPLMPSGKEKGH